MQTAGVVLAGGQSSRYGKPKMFECYQEKPFYQYSLDALSANGLSPLFISTNSLLAPRFKTEHAALVIEQTPHNGPLFALYQVMRQCPEASWFFVLSADIPLVSAHFVRELLLHINDCEGKQAIIPVQLKKWQPLLALYHRSCLPAMEQVLLSEKRSFQALLPHIQYVTVEFPAEEPAFININKKEDFENLSH